jgi:RNA polymerase sigma-70 factor, ECF subfamily
MQRFGPPASLIDKAHGMLSDKTDQALVQKYIGARDERSFRELYRRHTPALYALGLRLCGSESDAQDAIQETWLRACCSLSRFRWQSKLRTWLSGILVNCAHEQTRKRMRDAEAQSANDWTPPPTFLAARLVDLDQTIASLPDGYRHVLTLHDIEGYTHEEISEFLEITVGTSRSQLHHARKAIRALFLEEEKNERTG